MQARILAGHLAFTGFRLQTGWCFGKQGKHRPRHCRCRDSQTLGLTVRAGMQQGCAAYSTDGLVSVQSNHGSGRYKDLEEIQC